MPFFWSSFEQFFFKKNLHSGAIQRAISLADRLAEGELALAKKSLTKLPSLREKVILIFFCVYILTLYLFLKKKFTFDDRSKKEDEKFKNWWAKLKKQEKDPQTLRNVEQNWLLLKKSCLHWKLVIFILIFACLSKSMLIFIILTMCAIELEKLTTLTNFWFPESKEDCWNVFV